MTETERAELLRRHEEATLAYERSLAAADAKRRHIYASVEEDAKGDQLLRQMDDIEAAYYAALDRFAMGVCTVCARPLYRTFDPFGLDGLWWRGDATPPEVTPCPHFCVLTGALAFNGRPPSPGRFRVHAGPAAPFVLPRLLRLDGVGAVLCQLDMNDGCTAFTVAYFAKRRPPPQELTAPWPRGTFVYKTQFSERGWRGPAEDRDFDLRPWLEAGRLVWCDPGSDRLHPRRGVDSCPFVGLA